ncbi:MAG: methyltransferase domain-containing protein [Proteobacteria bacterium]|nr:methyltransferase domain-containing protein [Pseudomonadota bacterium]
MSKMNKNPVVIFKQKLNVLFRLLFNSRAAYRRSFFKYHLIRRKYILSKSCEVLGKDKFAPAPLLNKKILDVGCGFNQISDELALRGGNVLAIDGDLEHLVSAKNRGESKGSPVCYEHIKYEELDESNKFDVILLLEVLTTQNIRDFLQKAQKLLNKDGVIIISSSNLSFKSFIRNIVVPKVLFRTLNLRVQYKDLINISNVKKELNDIEFIFKDVQGVDFNFSIGRWYKTRSTRVRYLLHCVHKDNNLVEKQETEG